MCDKALDNYPHKFKFVPSCYITQKMCKQLSILIILEYNIEEMCDKAVNNCLLAFTYTPD